MRKASGAIGWLALALLIASSALPFALVANTRGMDPAAATLIAVITGLTVGISVLLRARFGLPTSPEGLALVASMPLLVLAGALVSVRLTVGFGAPPDFILDQEAAIRTMVVWRERGIFVAMGLVVALLSAAALVLAWSRDERSGRRLGLVVLLIAAAALFLLPFDFPSSLRLVRVPARLMQQGIGYAWPGAQVGLAGASWVCVVSLAMLAVGRTSNVRRMVLGTVLCALAVVIASYPESLQNEFPGFFCFQEPPGAASYEAMVTASHRATLAAGAMMGVAVLLFGARISTRGRRRPSRRRVALAVLVGAPALVSPVCLLTAWDDAAHAPGSSADPVEVSAQLHITLPSIAGRPSWWRWRNDYRWTPVVASGEGVRTRHGSIAWAEVEAPAGADRLGELMRSDIEPETWQLEPTAVRLYADADLPMHRIHQLVEAGRLDGFSLVVNAQAEPYSRGLAVAERETNRLIVWVDSLADDARPPWLSPGRILRDRPSGDTPLGDWIALMDRRAEREERRLVLLERR